MSRTVGHSDRTPAKHLLLHRVLGRTTGVAWRMGARCIDYTDLCAGDGVAADGNDFWRGTSPGLMIYHAEHAYRYGMGPVVDLYEINRNTFDCLIDSLTKHLGLPVAFESGRAAFHHTVDGRPAVFVRATLGSGKDASVDHVQAGHCMFVNNDPNTIHDWAMRSSMVNEIRSHTWMCTTFSTMGCNVGGLKMMDPNERWMWYGHLRAIKDSLPDHMDLTLSAIHRDSAQWAYAITSPTKWRDRTESDIRSAFKKIGRDMRVEWWRRSPQAFMALEHALYRTKTENDGQAPLW